MRTLARRAAITACLMAGALFAASNAGAAEDATDTSLLVVTGDPMLQVRVGLEQHCTEMAQVDQSAMTQKDRLDVILKGGQSNWVSLSGVVNDQKCEGLISFVPEVGVGYIARLSKRLCLVEIYQAKKGEAPVLKKAGNAAEFHGALCSVTADASSTPRLATAGSETRLLVGQDGYCGKMDEVKARASGGAVLKSDVRNWVRIVHNGGRVQSEGDFSFVPKPGTVYYLQGAFNAMRLFRVMPDGETVRETMTPEADRNCLFQ